MCGIIGRVGSDNAVPYILNGLDCLEYRGYDSAGIAVFNKNNIDSCKTVGRLAGLRKTAESKNLNGFVGIGHTRWATHGAASERNAHPHFSNNRKWFSCKL